MESGELAHNLYGVAHNLYGVAHESIIRGCGPPCCSLLLLGCGLPGCVVLRLALELVKAHEQARGKLVRGHVLVLGHEPL